MRRPLLSEMLRAVAARAASWGDDGKGREARRRFTLCLCALLFMCMGVFFAMSPLMLPVSRRLLPDDADGSGAFIYAVSGMHYILTAIGAAECFYVRGRRRLRAVVLAGLVCWPCGLLALAAAVTWQQLALLAVATPLLAATLGTFGAFMQHVTLTTHWGDDVNLAHSKTGLSVGLGAVFGTLFFGLVTERAGIVATLWLLFAVHSAGFAAVAALADPVRSLEEPDTSATSAVGAGVEEDDAAAAAKPTTPASCAAEKGEEQQEEEDDHDAVRAGSLALPAGARGWRKWADLWAMIAFIAAGFCMKNLLSVIFEQALRLPYLDATLLSAFCLACYCLGRWLTPLLAGPGDAVFLLFGGVLLLEAVAYAVSPWAIQSRHSVWVYTAFRAVSGAGFAILLGNSTVLLVRIFGPDERVLRHILGTMLLLEWLAALGAPAAWLLHSAHEGAESQSYDSAFFMCAGLVLSASAVTGLLWCGRRK